MDAAAQISSSGAKPIDKEADQEAVMSNKRPKLSTGRRSKVCIICLCEGIQHCGFYLYIVDLDDDVGSSGGLFVRRLPNLHLADEFGLDGFCVVGSTLYVFEGNSDRCRPPFRKSVFAIDLSSPDYVLKQTSSNNNIVTLGKKDLTRVGVMLHTKKFPIALPTRDGKKILIVSTLINTPPFHHKPSDLNYFDYAKDDPNEPVCPDGVDFELYDVDTNSSTKLPRIPHESADCVVGYAFDNNNVLHLQLRSRRMYSLDLLSPVRKWGPSHLPHGCLLPESQSWLIGKELCFSRLGAYDFLTEGYDGCPVFVPFPVSAMQSLPSDRRIARVYGDGKDDGGERDFCVVSQPFIDRVTKFPFLTVDVCAFDGVEYGGEKVLEFRKKKTFNFSIGDSPCSLLWGVDMFLMS